MASRLFLILLLPLIAMAVYWDGQNYEPEKISFRASDTLGSAEIRNRLPQNISECRSGKNSRTFTKEDLYEYINGHAEFFIAAGFRSLVVSEYFSKGPDPAFVIEIYEMGNAPNAFGVLMEEKGTDSRKIAMGYQGYLSSRLVLFMRGPYYIKINLFEQGLEAESVARQVDAAFQDIETEIPQLKFLPEEYGIPGTDSFIKEDFMGQEFLTQTYLREYEEKGKQYSVFVCPNPSSSEPSRMERWLAFFRENGMDIKEKEANGLRYFEIHDPFAGDLALVASTERFFGLSGDWKETSVLSRLKKQVSP